MKLQIVGLCGYAGTGKDSVADVLEQREGFTRLAFADALRAEIVDGYGVPLALFKDRDSKELPCASLAFRHCKNFGFLGAAHLALEADETGSLADFLDAPRSPRQILQLWGTEYRRKQNPFYWTRIVNERVRVFRDGGVTRFVITDVRMFNEARTLRAMGGKLWRVVRPGGGPVNGHSSETGGLEFSPDVVIQNDGSIHLLPVRVYSVLHPHVLEAFRGIANV